MFFSRRFFPFFLTFFFGAYSWFDSARVKEALDNIPNTLVELKNTKVVKGEEYTLDNSSHYIVEFFLDADATTPVEKLNEAQTSCDECDEIII